MTTILLTCLSGVLGLVLGFAIGVYNSANGAKTKFGKWKIFHGSTIGNPYKYMFLANNGSDYIETILDIDGTFRMRHNISLTNV